MGMKCICLSRVSTGIQDLDQQTEKLIEAAHYAGYDDSSIICIEDKESAVCKNEEERNGLNKLKEYVSGGEVEMVIVYELSRIARRADVLYSIRDFLIKHNVQLQVLNPAFKLLKPDGTLDENSNILMGIFCSLSENEGYLRKARFKRGKIKAVSENRFINGTPLYGYRVDKEQHLYIYEPEAEVVQSIYNDFVNNGKTAKDIAIDLMNSGRYKCGSLNSGIQIVYKILHCCSYAGISASQRKNGYRPMTFDYIYPAIISTEMYEKSMKTFNNRKKYNKVHSKNDYLCRGLLRGADGIPFNVHTSHKTYAHIRYMAETTERTEIKIDTMDKFIWDIAVERRLLRPEKSVDEMTAKLNASIKEEEIKLGNLMARIKDNEEKIKRLEYRCIQGKISEEDADLFEKPIREELRAYNASKNSIFDHIRALNERLSNLSDEGFNVSETSLNELNFEDKYKLVRDEILSVIIRKVDKADVLIGVMTNIADDPDWYRINRRTKKAVRV